VSFAPALVLLLVACGSAGPKPAPSNTAPPAPPPIDAPELTACERYAALTDKIEDCTALTDEQRQYIQQLRTDTGASISENGLDGSEVDPEALCEDAIAYSLRTAKVPCHL
jgi:hypothetical protein